VLCGTVALAGWIGSEPAGLGLLGIENDGAPIKGNGATSATAGAEHVDVPRATALDEHSVADIASGSAALSDPPPTPQPATPPVLFAAVSPTDPVQNAARPAVNSEALDRCPEPDVCIDQYLWSLYQRTRKVDTIKVEERIKVKVKKKGKTRTVVKTLTKYRALLVQFGNALPIHPGQEFSHRLHRDVGPSLHKLRPPALHVVVVKQALVLITSSWASRLRHFGAALPLTRCSRS
jgi:hypothetical protein